MLKAPISDYVQCNLSNLRDFRFAWRQIDDNILYFLSYTTYLYALGLSEQEAINHVYPASPRRMADTLRALGFFEGGAGWGKVMEITLYLSYHSSDAPFRSRNMEIRLYIKTPLHFIENLELVDEDKFRWIIDNFVQWYLDEQERWLFYSAHFSMPIGLRILDVDEVEQLYRMFIEIGKEKWFEKEFLNNKPILLWCNNKAKISLRKAVGIMIIAIYKMYDETAYYTAIRTIDNVADLLQQLQELSAI